MLCSPTSHFRSTCPVQTRMGLAVLDQSVQSLISRGVAPSTLSAYKSGKMRYLAFCTSHHLSPLPLCESTLCHFISFLYLSSLSYQTIKLYLSSLRHMQIIHGLPDPSYSSFPLLTYTLRGIHRTGSNHTRPKRLLITPDHLRANVVSYSH